MSSPEAFGTDVAQKGQSEHLPDRGFRRERKDPVFVSYDWGFLRYRKGGFGYVWIGGLDEMSYGGCEMLVLVGLETGVK